MQQVVILGGFGDGLVAAQVLEDMAKAGQAIELIGFLNDHTPVGETIGGYPVLGKTGDWASLPESVQFHFSLLSVGKMRARAELIEGFAIPKHRWKSLIHPSCQIAATAQVGRGVLMTAFVVLQPGAHLGDGCSLRSFANIGHDVVCDDFVYVGPNATLAGYSQVAKGGFVAPNAILRDRCCMGEFSVLGAASAGLKDIPAGQTWLGVPAKRIA